MTNIQITDLNYASLEASIKEYLKDTPEFSGYNFEGTVMSRIVKILAYNTYHQSYFVNQLAAENYLDSAQLRENVVSKAKALDYTPRSYSAATANLLLTFTPFDSPATIIIPKYTSFRTSSDGITFNFLTLQDNYINADNGTYIKSIDVFEGQSYTYNINYDSNIEFYEIPDQKVDTSKLKVYVKENSLTTDREEYALVTDITEINLLSKVYYLQENAAGKFEIYFGDDVLGQSLTSGNVIQIEALINNGILGNDLTGFSPVGVTGYDNSNLANTYIANVTTLTSSSEGMDRETIREIKYSAPKKYAMQKRSVIAGDYKQYLLTRYPDIQSISVWGGEDNIPPVYGRVIISIKPSSGYVISNFRKSQIVADLKGRNVMSIDPLLIDPIFTYVDINSTVYFNSKLTTKTAEELFGSVADVITDFEAETLSKFEDDFLFSKLSTAIDSADASISSNDTTIKFEKRITPVYDTNLTYKMKFNVELYNPYEGYLGCLSSSGFKLTNTGINTCYVDDDGLGNVRIYYVLNNVKTYLNNTAGTIDYLTGEVILNSFSFTELPFVETEFKLFVEGASKSYQPLRNEILLLSFPKIKMFDTQQKNVVFSDVVDVLGNTSPLQTNSVLNTVVI